MYYRKLKKNKHKFISLFKIFSNSNLGFVKLHSWYYHIREFGGLNGMCTETFLNY